METRYVVWRPSHELRRAVAVAGLCLLSAACGDAGHRLGDGPTPTQGDTDALTVHHCEENQQLEPIDYMEDGDGSIEFTAGRGGVWFAFNDHTSTQEPDLYAESFAMSKIDPPRQGSRFAVHTSGSGFTKWGAGVGLDLRAQQPYDASGYAGISFWARRAPDIEFFELQLQVPDRATSPLGGQCGPGLCHDDFGDLIPSDAGAVPEPHPRPHLSEDWTYFHYTWDEMQAQDWSEQSLRGVTRIDPSKIYGIRFQVENKYPGFDFWIDDLAFMCHPE